MLICRERSISLRSWCRSPCSACSPSWPGGCWTWSAAGKPRAEERLDELKNPQLAPQRDERVAGQEDRRR